jgi:hypothetical protein
MGFILLICRYSNPVSSKQIREKSPKEFKLKTSGQKDKISIFNKNRSKSPNKATFGEFPKSSSKNKFKNITRIKPSGSNSGQPQFPIKENFKSRATPNRKGSKGFFTKLSSKDPKDSKFNMTENRNKSPKNNLYDVEKEPSESQNTRISLTGQLRTRFGENRPKDSPMRSSKMGNYNSRTHSMTRENIRKNSRMMSREKRLERYSRRTEKRSQSPGGGIKLKFGEMRKSKANLNFGQLTERLNKVNKSVEIDKKNSQKKNLNQTMNMKVGESSKRQNNNIFGDFIGQQKNSERGRKSNLTGLGKATIIKKKSNEDQVENDVFDDDKTHSFDTNSEDKEIQESEVRW